MHIILEFKGVVYFTCGHLLKETVANRTLNTQWTFFQFLNTSSRREDLYLRVNSRKTSSGPRFEQEMHQKRVHRDPWVFSCEVTIFVNVCSNMIEMKMFCRNWDDLAEHNFCYRMSELEYLHYRQKLLDLSQEVWRHWRTIEKPF